jgi:hypothetical protein
MSITQSNGYKIVEEESTSLVSTRLMLSTLMFDLSEDIVMTNQIVTNMLSQLEEQDKVSFISLYRNQITPNSYCALGLVKWVIPDSSDEYLAASDYCYPLFVAIKDPEDSDAGEVIQKFVFEKAESQHLTEEIMKEVFDE